MKDQTMLSPLHLLIYNFNHQLANGYKFSTLYLTRPSEISVILQREKQSHALLNVFVTDRSYKNRFGESFN